MSNQLFEDGDPFDLSAWKQAELMANAPPRPADGYVTCSLAWLVRVLPLVHSADQLVVVMLLYSRCLVARSRTVPLSNGDLEAFGISRFAKYRILDGLKVEGLISTEARNGRSLRVTLLDFP